MQYVSLFEPLGHVWHVRPSAHCVASVQYVGGIKCAMCGMCAMCSMYATCDVCAMCGMLWRVRHDEQDGHVRTDNARSLFECDTRSIIAPYY